MGAILQRDASLMQMLQHVASVIERDACIMLRCDAGVMLLRDAGVMQLLRRDARVTQA